MAISNMFTNASATGAAVQRKSSLDMAAFLSLLTTQLANQNPLDPMNDRDFFAQLAQLGTVQGIDKLSGSMDVTQANSMIGKHVTALRPLAGGAISDTLVDGVVVGMTTRDSNKYLQVREANGGMVEVAPGAIQSITAGTGDGVSRALDAANAANLIGKEITAPHPTLTGEKVSAKVTKVTFSQGQVLLSVTDRLGKEIQVGLDSVTGIGG